MDDEFVEMDLDGDGRVDAVGMDTNGDGWVDDVALAVTGQQAPPPPKPGAAAPAPGAMPAAEPADTAEPADPGQPAKPGTAPAERILEHGSSDGGRRTSRPAGSAQAVASSQPISGSS